MLNEVRRIHLLGIGGIGVSGVARILHGRGFEVSGSDVRESAITDALRNEGVRVFIGHAPSNLDGADVVVVSTAIPDTNVELVAAKERGIPVIHRSEVLSELIGLYRTVGVTGTHGKGTVSSMIAWVLDQAGLEPGFIIGGMLNNFGTNARAGKGDWMIVEVDESDGSHHNVPTDYVVCNFLELDHLNYYDDLNDIIGSMTRYLQDNPRLKEAFVNVDCDGNRRMIADVAMRPTGYGVEHDSEWRGEILGDSQMPIRFKAFHRNVEIGEFELNLPGRYNVVNAMAAIAVATRLNVDVSVIRAALATYQGMENRFTIVHGGGVTLVKDYNSHPTCMRKVLESARDISPGRIVSIFKPYRYTLIKYLQHEYGTAFAGSDEVIITKMYAAEEDPIPGVSTQTVVDRIRENGLNVTYIDDQTQIPAYLEKTLKPGDQAIFFGGDDFFRMADAIAAELAVRAGSVPDHHAPLVSGPLTHEVE
ncbi:MAG: UDP-N-acetylmuramate--L-alanine ligase [bacterium]